MLATAAISLPVGGFIGCIFSVFMAAGNTVWQPPGRKNRSMVLFRGGDPAGKILSGSRASAQTEAAPRAPVEGLERTIHESLCAEVRYGFWRGEAQLRLELCIHAKVEAPGKTPWSFILRQ